MQSLLTQEIQSKECDAMDRCGIGQYQDYQRLNLPFNAIKPDFVLHFCIFCNSRLDHGEAGSHLVVSLRLLGAKSSPSLA